MIKHKLFLSIILSLAIIISGCSSISSQSRATPSSASSEYKSSKPSDGVDKVLILIAGAAFMAMMVALGQKAEEANNN